MSRRKISSSFSSPVRTLEEIPNFWKLVRISSRQNAWIVLICARSRRSCCRCKRSSAGFSAIIPLIFSIIRCFISSAAALEKVTTSIRSASIGLSASKIRPITRSTNTAVFPLPAAAETSTVPPRAWIASICCGVHFFSDICFFLLFQQLQSSFQIERP